jgi:hypothetical protein
MLALLLTLCAPQQVSPPKALPHPNSISSRLGHHGSAKDTGRGEKLHPSERIGWPGRGNRHLCSQCLLWTANRLGVHHVHASQSHGVWDFQDLATSPELSIFTGRKRPVAKRRLWYGYNASRLWLRWCGLWKTSSSVVHM